jgi:hypothetical protein
MYWISICFVLSAVHFIVDGSASIHQFCAVCTCADSIVTCYKMPHIGFFENPYKFHGYKLYMSKLKSETDIQIFLQYKGEINFMFDEVDAPMLDDVPGTTTHGLTNVSSDTSTDVTVSTNVAVSTDVVPTEVTSDISIDAISTYVKSAAVYSTDDVSTHGGVCVEEWC